jgi:hypothetical protein
MGGDVGGQFGCSGFPIGGGDGSFCFHYFGGKS